MLDAGPDADMHIRGTTRAILITGIILYAVGTVSFIGIAVVFFTLRMFTLSAETRLAFAVLFCGLFATFQGLIFIVVARGGESRREQMDYLLGQIRIIHGHSAPSKRAPSPPVSD